VEIFEAWPVVLFIVTGLLGLIVGSFLNVVAYRVPLMLERAWRAQCEELESESAPPQKTLGEELTSESPLSQETQGEELTSESPPSQETQGEELTSESPLSQETQGEELTSESPPSQETQGEELTSESPLSQETQGEELTSESPPSQETQAEEPTSESPPPPKASSDRFDLWWPGSACPACHAPIRARHNVPVLSFLWLKGRCASCSAKISPRYPIVEASAALLAIAVAAVLGATPQAVAALGFTWMLLALTLIDLDHKLLPDSMTLPLLWAGLILNAAGLFAPLLSSVIGAVAGYLALWSVYHLFKLVTGKEGMGYGDFKLLAAIGAWVGWQLLPMVILLSAAVGSVVGVSLIVFRGRSSQVPIPFGPYLAVAGWVALLWGQRLVQIYESWALG
jgi:leader peptidase (prepilin peptidase)/N-methyltransferase